MSRQSAGQTPETEHTSGLNAGQTPETEHASGQTIEQASD